MTTKQRFVMVLTALAATSLLAAGCGGGAECGAGTVERNGECVLQSPTSGTCGEGTTLQDGLCVLDDSGCGDGTALINGVCAPTPTVCGEGTEYDEALGTCVSSNDIECGEGTQMDDSGTCVPTGELCIGGTRFEGGRCVVSPGVCGPGTQLDVETGECLLTDETCEAPLVFVDGRCEPTSGVCGEGTVFAEDTGMCMPESTCRVGDVILDGLCVPPAAALAADPSAVSIDEDGVTTDLPEKGARFIFTGTIGSPDVVEQDIDSFAFNAEAGDLIKISVQSLGLPSPAFIVRGPEGSEFSRISTLGIEGDKARHLLLTHTGEYTVEILPEILVTDFNNILGPLGDVDWGYVGTLEQVELPEVAPVLVTDDDTSESFDGNVLQSLDNFYLVDNVEENQLIELTFDELGDGAETIVQFWENSTPPRFLNEQFVAKGATASVGAPADGLLIYVDYFTAYGPNRDYEVSTRISGFTSDETLDTEESTTLDGSVAPNTIIKVSFEGDDTDLFVQVNNAAGDGLGLGAVIGQGEPYYAFHSAGGDYTIDVENQGAAAVAVVMHVEYIVPTDLGMVLDNQELLSEPFDVSPGTNEFFLIETRPGHILELVQVTGREYELQSEVEEDAMFYTVFGEDGSTLVDDVLWPYERWAEPMSTGGGQFMAIHASYVWSDVFRTDVRLRVRGHVPTFVPEQGGFGPGDEFTLEHQELMTDGASQYFWLTMDERAYLWGELDAVNEGDVDLIFYDEDMEVVTGFGATGGEVISGTVLEVGLHLVRVQAWFEADQGFLGEFSLTNSGVPVHLAEPITILDGVTGTSWDGDHDHTWYSFTVPSVMALRFTAVRTDGGGWPSYWIHSEAGDIIHQTGSSSGSQQFGAVFQPNTTYYLRAGGIYSASIADPYDFAITVAVEALFDEDVLEIEPNDSMTTATALGTLDDDNFFVAAIGTVVGTESDYFEFTIGEDGTVAFQRDALFGGNSVPFRVVDAAGTELLAVSDNDEHDLALTAGTYYIEAARTTAANSNNTYLIYVLLY